MPKRITTATVSGDHPPALLGLRPIRLLTGLSDEILTNIAQAAQFKRYRRGQTILTRKDHERDLCLISAGHVRVILLSTAARAAPRYWRLRTRCCSATGRCASA